MNTTVVFQKIEPMFWDSEFQKRKKFEDFATILLLLAIARQSWDIPKTMVSNWHENYFETFEKRGWLRDKGDYYEMTLIFKGQSERQIEHQLMRGDVVEQILHDDEETFDVGRYTVQIEECREHTKSYLSKEVRA